jgi:prepilin peptidase CpaA
MTFPIPLLGVASALMLAAAGTDVWKRKIPNALNAALGLTGLWAQASSRGWMALVWGLTAGIVTLALLWVPWLKGRLGGGDVKMATAAAIWMGLFHLPAYLLLTAVAGGVVALASYLLSSRSIRREIAANLATAVAGAGLPEVPLKGGAGRVSVPFGVAVAMSGLANLWLGAGW